MASAMSPTIRYSKFMSVSLHRASLDALAGVDKRRQRKKRRDGDDEKEDVRHAVRFLRSSWTLWSALAAAAASARTWFSRSGAAPNSRSTAFTGSAADRDYWRCGWTAAAPQASLACATRYVR